ncbi:MAG: helix-turn-helix transcriptional regulator [Paenibacillus sp.]|uniref:AraC-type DNA-binding protein n=1 Tax=Paenibacillus aquistagni TaxID=1852522 RepID=A0A1X7LTB0_9BACL|nr:AraC family transcriptional regulator [Paenibacillus aquistagni]MBR2568719.1 helix-turn-helix transcriptional regulator [Paenibacillus sp.]NMM51959.1 AraC family transcriptional regulator [Paenibacillus aquistagni]SMG56727.1 AraC-type DNA-binding protein [Paenibacillus aquistagni]
MLTASPESYVWKPFIAKITCEPNWKWQKRELPMANYDLFYVWSGEGEVVLNDVPYQVGKGSCFLFRPGDHTSATHNPQKPLTLTYIHFDIDEEVHSVPEPYRVVIETIDFEHLLSRFVRLYLTKPYGYEVELQLVLKQLMISLLRADQEEPGERSTSQQLAVSIYEIANYIHQNPGIAHRIEDLAKRAQLSPRYFSVKFKEMIGVSVQSYIIRSRIERAEHLLHHAGMNVTEVADALGYRDIFFFSRQFKQYTGRSPSEIR